MGITNTNIKPGQLRKSDLEKISMAYLDCGFQICGKTLLEHTSVDVINEDNKNLKEYELNPQPSEMDGTRMVFSPKNCRSGDIYLDIKVYPGESYAKTVGEYAKLQEKFSNTLRDYLLHKK